MNILLNMLYTYIITFCIQICDLDNDGLLNDMELNAFQQWCFNTPLQPQVLEDVKAVLSKNIQDGICCGCVTMKGISHIVFSKGQYGNTFLLFLGFMYLQCLFIQRGRNETTWAVLRKFGYDNELQMSKEYIYPPLVHNKKYFKYFFTLFIIFIFYIIYRLKIPVGCTTELSHKGQEFLTLLFMQHDRDRDGALSPLEMESLFSRCLTPPWGDEYKYIVPTNEKVYIFFIIISFVYNIFSATGMDYISRIYVSMVIIDSYKCAKNFRIHGIFRL